VEFWRSAPGPCLRLRLELSAIQHLEAPRLASSPWRPVFPARLKEGGVATFRPKRRMLLKHRQAAACSHQCLHSLVLLSSSRAIWKSVGLVRNGAVTLRSISGSVTLRNVEPRLGMKSPVGHTQRRTRRAAVLFADMVGFSRQMELDLVRSAGQVAR